MPFTTYNNAAPAPQQTFPSGQQFIDNMNQYQHEQAWQKIMGLYPKGSTVGPVNGSGTSTPAPTDPGSGLGQAIADQQNQSSGPPGVGFDRVSGAISPALTGQTPGGWRGYSPQQSTPQQLPNFTGAIGGAQPAPLQNYRGMGGATPSPLPNFTPPPGGGMAPRSFDQISGSPMPGVGFMAGRSPGAFNPAMGNFDGQPAILPQGGGQGGQQQGGNAQPTSPGASPMQGGGMPQQQPQAAQPMDPQRQQAGAAAQALAAQQPPQQTALADGGIDQLQMVTFPNGQRMFIPAGLQGLQSQAALRLAQAKEAEQRGGYFEHLNPTRQAIAEGNVEQKKEAVETRYGEGGSSDRQYQMQLEGRKATAQALIQREGMRDTATEKVAGIRTNASGTRGAASLLTASERADMTQALGMIGSAGSADEALKDPDTAKWVAEKPGRLNILRAADLKVQQEQERDVARLAGVTYQSPTQAAAALSAIPPRRGSKKAAGTPQQQQQTDPVNAPLDPAEAALGPHGQFEYLTGRGMAPDKAEARVRKFHPEAP
jgi:hypothetical protein